MNANKRELVLKDEVYEVVSCSLEVHNSLGHGLHEKPYENALVVEFQERGIPFEQQRQFPIIYKDREVGIYVPDLLAFEQIVIDTKTVEAIGKPQLGQMLNYLKITGCTVGLILNFSKPSLEWQRVIHSRTQAD